MNAAVYIQHLTEIIQNGKMEKVLETHALNQ
jgi:hypothetical protein